MADTVDTAIYKLGFDTGSASGEVEKLTAATEKLSDATEKQVRAEEKVERATRTRADSLDKLLGRLDPAIAAQQKLQQVQQQISRFEEEGIGTEQQRAQALDLANKKYGEGADAAKGYGGILSWLSGQHKAAAEAGGAHASVTSALRDTMHAITPVARAAGEEIGGIRVWALAAGGGLASLGVALTGVVVAKLIEAADKTRVLKAELRGLTGSDAGATAAFNDIKGAADRAEISLKTVAGAYMTLRDAQDDINRKRGIIFAPGAESQTKQINDITEALSQAGKAGLLTEQQIKQAEDTLAQSFAQTGTLTAQAFSQLPRQIQGAIAETFGFSGQSLAAFRKQLGDTGISFDQFADGMSRKLDQLRQKNKETAPTVAQGWDEVTASIDHMFDTIAEKTGIAEKLDLGGFLRTIAKGMRQATDDPEKGARQFGMTLEWLGSQVLASFDEQMRQAGQVNLGIWNALTSAAVNYGNAIRNLPSLSGGAGPSGPGAAPGGGFSYGIPTQGGLGGYGGAGTPYTFNDYGVGADIGQVYSDLGYDNFASGTSGIRTVPPGFPNDSFSINLTSGEEYAVAPAGQSLKAMIAASPIRVDGISSERNFASGTGHPSVDAALSTEGQSLLDLAAANQDAFLKLGFTLQDVRQAISGAGNGNLADEIKLAKIETIAAMLRSQNATTQATTASGGQTTASVNRANVAITSAVNASTSSIVGAIGGVAAAVSRGGGIRGAGGRGLSEDDPLGTNALGIKLGNVPMNMGSFFPASNPQGRNTPPTTAPQPPPKQGDSIRGSTRGPGYAIPGAVSSAGKPRDPYGSGVYSPGDVTGAGASGNTYGYGIGAIPGYGNEGIPDYGSSSYYDPNAIAGIGNEGISFLGGEFAGDFAGEGDIAIPPGHPNDSVRVSLRAQSGEMISVRHLGNYRGNGSDTGVAASKIVNVYLGGITFQMSSPSDFGSRTPSQIGAAIAKAAAAAARAA